MAEVPGRTVLHLAADVVEQLPAIVRATRLSSGQTLREVEQRSGVPDTTLCRVEEGATCTTTTASKLLRWAASA